MTNKNLLLPFICCMLLSACGSHKNETGAKQDILLADMDTTVSPAQDFFTYANGGWLKSNPIPADEVRWGVGSLIELQILQRLRDINEDAAKKTDRSALEKQIADFWITGMDSAAADKNGIEPLRAQLNKIDSLQTLPEIMAYAAELHNLGVHVFYETAVQQDDKHSDQMAFALWQGGIGLPDRDYYFNTDTVTVKIRNAYPAYIARLLQLAGTDNAQAVRSADAIVKFETGLARASKKIEALRDPDSNYHKIAIVDLHKLAPDIDWSLSLKKMAVQHVDSVLVGQPEFYRQMDQLIKAEKIQTLKDYIRFQLVNEYAPYLDSAIVATHFNFNQRLIGGVNKMRPRWKRVLAAEQDALGEALGHLFVQKFFSDTAKQRYAAMAENIRNAYKARITQLDWMSDSTKQKALRKLATITKKVGYPDKWKDFSQLKTSRQSYAGNVMSAQQWWSKYNTDKLGKPVNRADWDMTPQTYDAYYNPGNNEIVLPAAIFAVPGRPDEELDEALVYGYTGASTIGHEITHGFDDEGRKYDDKGNLKNWWSAQDAVQFNKRAQVLARQFSNIAAVDTFHINGQATLGENLADLGGVLLGLDAFKQTDTYKKGENIAGLTPVQRYFLGYAYAWLQQYRREQIIRQLMTDVHSPAQFRVNGPLPNVNEFHEAFNVKPGDKMYTADSARVHLW